MQKKKFIITLLFVVLSIFMITACSDSSNESNSGGNNGGGGTVQPEPEPEPEPEIIKIKEILSNANGAVFIILDNDSLYAWGYNLYGRLGIGSDEEYVSEISKVSIDSCIYNSPSMKKLVMPYRSSSIHAIMEDGSLCAWGDNKYGQLGIIYSQKVVNTPTQVYQNYTPELTVGVEKVYRISYPNYTNSFLIRDGGPISFGWNVGPILGLSNVSGSFVYTPTNVELPDNNGYVANATDLIVGENNVFAQLDNDTYYAWGYNNSGHLGIGDIYPAYTPKLVLDLKPSDVKKLVIDDTNPSSNTYAVMNDGTLYAIGGNQYGQMGIEGISENKNTTTPTKIEFPENSYIEDVIAYASSVYAIMKNGSLYAWGANYSGRLGVGDEVNRKIPVKVELDGKIRELITNTITKGSVYAIMEDGSLYAWGDNQYGQLGIGSDAAYQNTPKKIDFNNTSAKVKKLFYHNGYAVFALMEDGSLYAWGSNTYGYLGNGDSIDKNFPTKVLLPEKSVVQNIIDTSRAIYAVMQDGSIYAWGNGRIINGNEEPIEIPVKTNLQKIIE